VLKSANLIKKHIGRNPRFDREQHLGTFGRHMEHWADIGLTEGRHWEDIGQTLGRHLAHIGKTLGRHWEDIGKTLGRHWADFGQTLGRHWADIGKTLGRHWADISVFSCWILSCKIRLFGFLMQDKTFWFSYPR
jgi:hypothetical protein